MGEDDITRIYTKLDGLATGQVEIRVNQNWVMEAVKAQGDKIDTLTTKTDALTTQGCAIGAKNAARIEELQVAVAQRKRSTDSHPATKADLFGVIKFAGFEGRDIGRLVLIIGVLYIVARLAGVPVPHFGGSASLPDQDPIARMAP